MNWGKHENPPGRLPDTSTRTLHAGLRPGDSPCFGGFALTLVHKRTKVKPQRLADSNGIKLHIARIVATTFTSRNSALRIGGKPGAVRRESQPVSMRRVFDLLPAPIRGGLKPALRRYSEANARQGIINLYNRHLDEFTEKDNCEIKLISQGQERNTRIFSPSGCRLRHFPLSPCLRRLFVHNAWRGLKTSGIAASAPVSCGFFMPVWATRYVGRAKNTIPARGIIPAVYFRLLSLPTPIAAKRGITSKK